jgi:hypothetical protein
MGLEVAMIELTPEQQAAFEGGENRVRDAGNATYVLVPEETYRRFQDLLEAGPLTGPERQVILKGVWDRAGWDDPRMDAYDALPGQS